MMPTTAVPTLLTDPGYIFAAPPLTAEPVNTVVGSKFTDAWPVAWVSCGATSDGSEWDYAIKTAAIMAAEFFDALVWRTTERSGTYAFSMMSWTLTNLKLALNGGTQTIVSGTTTTQLNSYTPPAPGAEIRTMIGWEALSADVRLIIYQSISSSTVKTTMKKAPATAELPVSLNFEVPSSGFPFKWYTSGVGRV
jgi:hypothetical protein